MLDYLPSYLGLYDNGQLYERIEALNAILEDCTLCPRKCHVNRLNDDAGYCKAGARAMVSSYFPHFGEESPLVGRHGSGTIFFSHCNLRCVFCQNYEISHLGEGEEVDAPGLAEMMISLQDQGCHNINLVSPTHYVPQIVEALPEVIEKGLNVPIVFNCSGYESVETLELLNGIVDIYMPDAKFADENLSEKYLNARAYFSVLKRSLLEMFRQVGELKTDSNDIAVRGMIIRHLVMPETAEDSREILNYIAQYISRDSYVNIMKQYRPCYRADEYPEINSRVSDDAFSAVLRAADVAGLKRIYG